MLLERRVDPLLKGAHLTLDNLFDLVRELTLNILFETSKKERTKDLVETTDNEKLLFLGNDDLVGPSAGERSIEPVVERFGRVEDLGKDEAARRKREKRGRRSARRSHG